MRPAVDTPTTTLPVCAPGPGMETSTQTWRPVSSPSLYASARCSSYTLTTSAAAPAKLNQTLAAILGVAYFHRSGDSVARLPNSLARNVAYASPFTANSL